MEVFSGELNTTDETTELVVSLGAQKLLGVLKASAWHVSLLGIACPANEAGVATDTCVMQVHFLGQLCIAEVHLHHSTQGRWSLQSF